MISLDHEFSTLPKFWRQIAKREGAKPYFQSLVEKIGQQREQKAVYPPSGQVLEALRYFDLDKTRVVIIGQDPYHGSDQAHGLAFSVNEGVMLPPSLRNIFKELRTDVGVEQPMHGCLINWAKQGVLLLNSILTVNAGEPASHHNYGWQTFTDTLIEEVAASNAHVVFILWGKFAQKKQPLILSKSHLILESAHPSPLSARHGFFGSRPFSKANVYLEMHGRGAIDWTIR